jgi:hypothetical protein
MCPENWSNGMVIRYFFSILYNSRLPEPKVPILPQKIFESQKALGSESGKSKSIFLLKSLKEPNVIKSSEQIKDPIMTEDKGQENEKCIAAYGLRLDNIYNEIAV